MAIRGRAQVVIEHSLYDDMMLLGVRSSDGVNAAVRFRPEASALELAGIFRNVARFLEGEAAEQVARRRPVMPLYPTELGPVAMDAIRALSGPVQSAQSLGESYGQAIRAGVLDPSPPKPKVVAKPPVRQLDID